MPRGRSPVKIVKVPAAKRASTQNPKGLTLWNPTFRKARKVGHPAHLRRGHIFND